MEMSYQQTIKDREDTSGIAPEFVSILKTVLVFSNYPLQLLPMVPLAASFSNGPNVFPLSVLIFITASLFV
jgi:hypothetical protein